MKSAFGLEGISVTAGYHGLALAIWDQQVLPPNSLFLEEVLALSVKLLALSLSTIAFANFSGSVVSVLDGDTIEILHNQHPERIRLSGIDCPEKGQAYGHLAFGKGVTIQSHRHDKYKRTLADVSYSMGPCGLILGRCRRGSGGNDARNFRRLDRRVG